MHNKQRNQQAIKNAKSIVMPCDVSIFFYPYLTISLTCKRMLSIVGIALRGASTAV